MGITLMIGMDKGGKMTLSKVIELLTIEAGVKLRTGEIDLRNSIKVSVEAVKEIKRIRLDRCGRWPPILPGETPE